MPDARLARRHRANIGTIVSDASMSVQILHGARLGSMEESFLSRLSPGDAFVFAGQVLELVRIEDMRSEEHTSELQSQSNLVCRLLLEKKKMRLLPSLTVSRH